MRLLALLLLLTPAVVGAQGTGTLAGRVTDDIGMGLPGANVLVEGTTLGAATDADGAYRIPGVPVGEYAVTASFIGYGSGTQAEIRINAGDTRNLDFALTEPPFMPGVVFAECFVPLVYPDAFASRVVSSGPSGWACGFPVGLADLPVER